MNPELDEAAQLYDYAAEQLDRAARHCKVSAQHFRSGEIPRGTAHAWAALGHIREADERLDAQARKHSTKAQLD